MNEVEALWAVVGCMALFFALVFVFALGIYVGSHW
jgi:hypothetical protein